MMCVYLTLSLWATEGPRLWSIDQYPRKADRFLWASVLYRVLIGLLCGFSWMRVCIPEAPGLLHFTKGKGGDKDPKLECRISCGCQASTQHSGGVHGATGTGSISSKPEETFSMETWLMWCCQAENHGPGQVFISTSREPGWRTVILICPLL